MSLTLKQEAFCQKYLELGSAAAAYRAAYAVKKMSDEAIRVEGFRLLENPKVSLRVQELQKAAAKRHELTIDDILAELEEAREMAKNAVIPNPGVMVTASMGKAKIAGLIKDRQEVTGLNGGPIEHSIAVKFVSP